MRALVLLFALCAPLTAFATQPNVILIYTDDHGWSDLGIHGLQSDLKTPHLDALARSGVVAKNGYSTAPQCVPSRAGLLTGRFQARFGVESNQSALDGFNRQTTIAKRLQNAGYITAQFGKWHLGPSEEIPRHGFTHVFSQHNQHSFHANIGLDGQDRDLSLLPPTAYHIDACSQAAAATIARYKDHSFFLYIAYRAPHTPLDAPQHYKDRFPGAMPERRRAALGMLAAIDDGIGLLTSTLKKHGLTKNTLLFFIGDNGAPLKIHKVDSPLAGDPGGWDGSLNEPLNGEKGMLAEGGMHVPFLIAWPGTIPGGQVYEHPVSALDVAATVVGVQPLGDSEKSAQTSTLTDLDGVNLLPYLTGEKKDAPHEFLAWRWIAQSAIREGNWKLLRGGDREYLYNLAEDISEKHDLASQEPEIAARLRTKLTAWCADLTPPGLSNGEMAANWHQYFDHYLEGKPAPNPSAKPELATAKTRGWMARGGRLIEKDGLLFLTPDKAAKGCFITNSQIKAAPPTALHLTLKTTAKGPAAIAWRAEGDKDFLPANRLPFELQATPDWQTHSLPIPATARIIHLRVHLPGTAEIQEIVVRAKKR